MSKVEDAEKVTCSQGSTPLDIQGVKVSELDFSILCPPSPEGRKKEQILQVVCVMLAVFNIIVFSKLLFDYRQYKNKGKLPRIVHWIPYL